MYNLNAQIGWHSEIQMEENKHEKVMIVSFILNKKGNILDKVANTVGDQMLSFKHPTKKNA